VKLIDSGAAQLGLITMGVGLQGWNGTGDWTNGKRFQDMRALHFVSICSLASIRNF
jgi:TRAP-type uncharacterized transport system substrate-binding protein